MSEIVEEVLAALRHRLGTENSVLVRDPAAFEELARQVGYVLEDVLARADRPAGSGMAPTGEARLFSVEVGVQRARQGVHPVESLRAATALFEVALPVIAARFAGDAPQLLAVSLALHEAIMDRVVLGALSYVDFLLDKLQASRREERRRIARELHDRVSHGMGLALQNLELHRHYVSRDAERAEAKLTATVGALNEALRTVGQLSAELRRSVGIDGIEQALQAYLKAAVPAPVQATLTITGDAKALPPSMSEELYLIMREATRNALRHADPTELRLALAVAETTVTAAVTDNGSGFDPETVVRAPGGGLLSMSERAQLLRGTLELASAPGNGTTVTVRVPLAGNGL